MKYVYGLTRRELMQEKLRRWWLIESHVLTCRCGRYRRQSPFLWRKVCDQCKCSLRPWWQWWLISLPRRLCLAAWDMISVLGWVLSELRGYLRRKTLRSRNRIKSALYEVKQWFRRRR